nr:MAG TPA: hypothetical protein [Caudoviricetes sp.]DAU80429.1 MAG TPA: hypothetical protein [Caudoviricetes sp.]
MSGYTGIVTPSTVAIGLSPGLKAVATAVPPSFLT